LANFKRGSKVVIKARSCDECKNNRHRECDTVAGMEFMAAQGDVREVYPFRTCECFNLDEERHW
jgi:hypothetical protein